jgi:hypothetical protein
MAQKPKRPRDTNQLAKFIVALASGEIEEKVDDGKIPAAVAPHMMFYNFGRIHKSLRITPAMAAGVSDHVWTLEEITGHIP